MSKRYTHALSPKTAKILRAPDAEGRHVPAKRLTKAERSAFAKKSSADAVEGEAGKTMTYIMTDELVRREVGTVLRVDYRGKFLCSSWLVKLVRDTLGLTTPRQRWTWRWRRCWTRPAL
jgi:hypothetical protein